MKLSRNRLYMLIQCLFWMAYCACYGYISYFLVAKGFGTTMVGILTAVSGIMAAFGQPLIGALADRPEMGYKKPLLSVLALMSASGVMLAVFTHLNYAAGICIALSLVMLLSGLGVPLLNTAGVAFPGEINFGMARATGSFGYAAGSYIMGFLTAGFGPIMVPVFISLVSATVFIAVCGMPERRSPAAGNRKASGGSKGFLGKYPSFTFLWLVFIAMLTVHCLSNSFLLQILEKGGGNSRDLGIATAIAALMEMPMIFFYEKINRHISTRGMLIIAAATYLIRSVLQLVSSSLPVLYMIQLLQFSSWGIYASASVYYARNSIPEQDLSKAQAYMANTLTIGTVIGSLIGGTLIERYNVNVMLIFQTAMAVLTMCGMLVWAFRYEKTE